MRNLFLIVVLCSITACANNQANESTNPSPAAVSSIDGTTAFLGNATCPISGHPIKSDAFIEHAGQRAYLCCSKCVASAQKDPAGTIEKAYPAATAVGNTVCPVSGKPAGTDNMVTWQGHTVAVCCGRCEKKFASDPSGYTQKAIVSAGN